MRLRLEMPPMDKTSALSCLNLFSLSRRRSISVLSGNAAPCWSKTATTKTVQATVAREAEKKAREAARGGKNSRAVG